ncbi:BamA/TamA family outer membrane protein [bacterium]|nr:BamA/TamA family outer membrane protein [candidate division CSSED10-310 bacterium]
MKRSINRLQSPSPDTMSGSVVVLLWIIAFMVLPLIRSVTSMAADTNVNSNITQPAEPDTTVLYHIDCVALEPKGIFNHFEFSRLSSIRPPVDVSIRDIQKVVDNLMKTRKASHVVWEIIDAPCGHQLVFNLTLNSYVKKLSFSGNHQIGDLALNRATDLRKFGPFNHDLLENSLVRFREYYRSRGYPEPGVTAQIQGPDKGGAVGIDISVAEHSLPRPELMEFSVSGYPGYWWNVRINALFTYLEWRIRHRGLNLIELKNRLKSEQRKLRDSGYRTAEITIETLPNDTDAPRELKVLAALGTPVDIQFNNVGFFTQHDILHKWKSRHVTLSDSELENLTKQTREALQNKGWIDAEVTAAVDEQSTETRVIVTAKKGLRRYIDDVIQNGVSPVPTSEISRIAGLRKPWLLGIWKTRPGPETLDNAVKGLKTHLENQGYIRPVVSMRLTDQDSSAVAVEVTIQPGPYQLIGKVEFDGVDGVDPVELKKIDGKHRLINGQPFVNRFVRNAMTDITRFYWKHGFSDMTIRAVTRQGESATDLKFEVQEGPAYRQGPVIVAGNVKTHSSLIYRLERIMEGTPFELERAGRLQDAMYQTGVFDTVSIRTEKDAESDPPSQTLIMDVTERSTGEFETGIDYNTDRGFEGLMDLGERNFFGRALHGRLSALLGENRWTLSASLQRPLFWSHRLENRFRAVFANDRTNEEYDLQTLTLEMGIVRRWANNKTLNVTYAYERENVRNIDPDVAQAIDIGDTRSGSLTPVFTIDKRDDPFRTSRGWLYQTRLKNSFSVLGSESEFIRWDHDVRFFYPIDKDRLIMGMALRTGRAWLIQGSLLPASERFYLGGASTNRGFDHQMCGPRSDDGDALGGESYVLANIELRFHIAGNMKGAVFIDAGNVFAATPEPPYLRPSAGIGLRYSTPIGPIRCDIGWNLDHDPGEPGYAIQVALGHAF